MPQKVTCLLPLRVRAAPELQDNPNQELSQQNAEQILLIKCL